MNKKELNMIFICVLFLESLKPIPWNVCERVSGMRGQRATRSDLFLNWTIDNQ